MKRLRISIASLVLLGVVWQLAHLASKGIGVPSLSDTLHSLYSNFWIIMYHLSISLLRIVIANIFAMILGSILGYLMASSKRLDDYLSPSIYALIPVPKVAFLPLFMLLFGIGEKARILLLVFILVFQYIVAAKDAIQSLTHYQNDIIQSLKLKKSLQLRYIFIPHYLPYLFTVLRQSFGMSLAVLFYVETFINQVGIGYYIMNRWSSIYYSDMFAGIIMVSICGILGYKFIDTISRKLSPWKN